MRIITAVIATAMFLSSCGQGQGKSSSGQNGSTGEKISVVELNAEKFRTDVYDYNSVSDKFVFKGEKPAVIDFYATWCGPCKKIAPIMEDLAGEYSGEVVFYKIDVDQEPEIAEMFGVQSIPTIYYIPLSGEPQYSRGAENKTNYKDYIDRILLGR